MSAYLDGQSTVGVQGSGGTVDGYVAQSLEKLHFSYTYPRTSPGRGG